jgi:hypothetical protein
MLTVFEVLNEIPEIPRVILLHVINQILGELLLIKLPSLLILCRSNVLIEYPFKVHLVLSKYLLLFSLPFFLLVLFPFLFGKLFFIKAIIIILLLIGIRIQHSV